jgi:hypothetical protein
MADLKSLDQLQKPLSSPNPSPPGSPVLNKKKPDFAKSENMAKTLIASANLRSSSRTAPPPSKASSSSKAPPADKKMEKIYKIDKYFKAFERLRKTIEVPHNLMACSEAELDQILFNIHRALNAAKSERFLPLVVGQMFFAVETATMQYGFNPLDMDLTGLAKVAMHPNNNKELMEIAQELYIEYEHWFAMGPARRFMMEVAGMIMTVNSYNKASKTPVSKEQREEMERELGKENAK